MRRCLLHSRGISPYVTRALRPAAYACQAVLSQPRLFQFSSSPAPPAPARPPDYRDQNDTWVDRHAPEWLTPYLKLTRIDRPVGTWLVLLPGYWGLALAAAPGALPSLPLAVVFTSGAFVMRSAGCTINDIWDRRFDAQVARTSQRPLARGTLSLPAAWAFLGAQLGLGLVLLSTLSPEAVALGCAIVPVVGIYPALKRVTHLPQVVLGTAMNWGVVMGWAAVHGVAGLASGGAAALYCGGILWTVVYDTIYAHQDRDDDARLGLRSTALLLGDVTRPVLLALATAAGGAWVLAGVQAGLASPYFVAVAGAWAHMAWQAGTADYGSRASLATRFNSSKWAGALLLAGIVAGRILAADREAEKASAPVISP